MNEELHEVIITTPSYGDFSGVSIFLTPAIREKFKEISKKDGRPLIDKLGEGSAVQGLKHLIIKIKGLNKDSKLILTDGRTHQEGNQFYINYEEYRRKASERFYELYRETGLDIASSYLNSYFPDEFEYDPNELKESDIKRIQKEIPSLIREAPDTEKNQLALVEKTTESLKKVRRKNKHLELAYQQLQQQSNLTHFTTRLSELQTRLNSTKGFHETKGDNSWQSWIFQNKWLFGTQYLPPIEKKKVGFDSIPDFLFPTFDGFLDIIEIKLPKFEVVRKDDSHAGS